MCSESALGVALLLLRQGLNIFSFRFLDKRKPKYDHHHFHSITAPLQESQEGKKDVGYTLVDGKYSYSSFIPLR